MKILLALFCGSAALYAGSGEKYPAPSVPTGSVVAPGKFETWFPKGPGWTMASDGVRVTLAAMPCDHAKRTDDSCSWEGFNNQARVTITAPGIPAFTAVSDGSASYYRVAVVRLNVRDARPGVVLQNETGGSGGAVVQHVFEPVQGGFRKLVLTQPLGDGSETQWIEGTIADHPRDLNGDGRVDFVLSDGRFDSAFGCNACTPRPPLVLSIVEGRRVDITRDRQLAPLVEADLERNRATCFSDRDNRNGSCAAYVADAALLGRSDQAWPDMLRHYDRTDHMFSNPCGSMSADANQSCADDARRYRDFPGALRAFLRDTGYIR